MKTREFHMGSLSVLLCVTVLCVAVFAALTVVTAAADVRMARRSGAYTEQWYALENAGTAWLARMKRWQGGELPEGTAVEAQTARVTLRNEEGILEIRLSLSDGALLQWDHTAAWQPDGDWSLWPGEGADSGD